MVSVDYITPLRSSHLKMVSNEDQCEIGLDTHSQSAASPGHTNGEVLDRIYVPQNIA